MGGLQITFHNRTTWAADYTGKPLRAVEDLEDALEVREGACDPANRCWRCYPSK
jgi:hypothetical protein